MEIGGSSGNNTGSSSPTGSGPSSPSGSNSTSGTDSSNKPESATTTESVSSTDNSSGTSETDSSSGTSDVQTTADAPATGSASDLQDSGDEVESDPEASGDVVETQAEVAEAATGTPTDAEVAEFEELRAELATLRDTDPSPHNPDFVRAMEIADTMNVTIEAKTIEYMGAVTEMENAFDDLKKKAEMANAVTTVDGAFMTEEQQVALQEHMTEFLAPEVAVMEDASVDYLQATRDPITVAITTDNGVHAQLDFIETASEFLGYTPTGQERIGEFMDGLAGVADDPMAEMAAGLREHLEGPDLERLDRALGLMAGIDSQFRPEEVEVRLEAIEAATGVNLADGAFKQAMGIGADAFSALAGPAVGGVETAAGQIRNHLDDASSASKVLGVIGNVAGGAGAFLGTVEAVNKALDGDLLNAAGAAAGVASFALRTVAPRVAGPLGWASTAISAFDAVKNQSEWANFRREALDAAMGDDPLKNVLVGATAHDLTRLNLDPSLPPREALIQRADSILPDWATMQPGLVPMSFWPSALADASFRAQMAAQQLTFQ